MPVPLFQRAVSARRAARNRKLSKSSRPSPGFEPSRSCRRRCPIPTGWSDRGALTCRGFTGALDFAPSCAFVRGVFKVKNCATRTAGILRSVRASRYNLRVAGNEKVGNEKK